MNYKIFCNGKLIAKFLVVSDRDFCLDALREEYGDTTFTTEG